MRFRLPLAMCVAVATACRQDPPPPYQTVATMKQLMANVLEPAADVYWDAVGSVVDSTGTKEFAPTTPEEWARVRNSAYVIAETGNLLMLPGRALDSTWTTYARAMIDASRKAIAAADSMRVSAVFDAGAEVYDTCVQCHARYAIAAPPNGGK